MVHEQQYGCHLCYSTYLKKSDYTDNWYDYFCLHRNGFYFETWLNIIDLSLKQICTGFCWLNPFFHGSLSTENNMCMSFYIIISNIIFSFLYSEFRLEKEV